MSLSAYELVNEKSLKEARLVVTLLDVFALLRSDRGNTDNVAEALRFDPSVAGRVIATINASGIDNRVNDLNHAVSMLGFRKVRELIIQKAQGEFYKTFRDFQPYFSDVRKHSVAVACLSKEMAKHLKLSNVDEVYEASLMHDMGKYLLLMKMPKEYAKVLREKKERELSLQYERDEIGVDHTEVGVQMVDEWDLPDETRAAVKYHHGITEDQKLALTTDETWAVDIVSYSNLMAQPARITNKRSAYRPILTDLPTPPGDMTIDELSRLVDAANNHYFEMMKSMGM